MSIRRRTVLTGTAAIAGGAVPDGHTLFVNIQASAGMTFAIWGPWERIGV